MTYRDLVNQLLQLPQARLDDTVTVFDPYTDEYTAVVDGCVAMGQLDDGVLDLGHFYLVLKA